MASRVLLRLDDGSLVGPGHLLGGPPGQIVRIDFERAAQLERGTEKDVQRLRGLLDRLSRQYSASALQLQPAQQPFVAEPDAKRPRQSLGQPQQAPIYAGAHGWVAKALEVLNAVADALQPVNKPAFWFPVSVTDLPNYYTIIKRPIFLGDIEKKLQQNAYASSSDFAADMRLHWSNVRKFNSRGTHYYKIGVKAEEVFENLWAASGYSVERARRATAGLAPPKFDVEKDGGRSKTPRTGSRPSRALAADAPISQERRNQMANFLNELPDEHSDHFMTLLPPELLKGMESGELELDFDALDDATLRRIDGWLRQIRPDLTVEAPASPTIMSQNPSGIKADSYSDDDYNGESEEDTD